MKEAQINIVPTAIIVGPRLALGPKPGYWGVCNDMVKVQAEAKVQQP